MDEYSFYKLNRMRISGTDEHEHSMESVEIRRNAGLRFSSEDYPRIRLGE